MSDHDDQQLITAFLDAAGFDYSINEEEGVLGFDLVVRVYGRLVSRPDPYLSPPPDPRYPERIAW